MNDEHRHPAVRDQRGTRQRTPLEPVRRVPRKERRAELVCRRDPGPPHLLAVVYPRALPVDALRVNTGRARIRLGADFAAACPCGMRHDVDGGKLRSAVAAGRPNRLTVVSVSDVLVGT